MHMLRRFKAPSRMLPLFSFCCCITRCPFTPIEAASGVSCSALGSELEHVQCSS
jgi:hypothetical protein